EITLEQLPAQIRHTADVALAGYGAGNRIMNAHIDLDDVTAIYEVEALSADGRHLEVDVRPDGSIEEIEVQLSAEEVPANVMDELRNPFPAFQKSKEEVKFERSRRPAKNGLIELWYEFSPPNFDVETRSDAKAPLIDPP